MSSSRSAVWGVAILGLVAVGGAVLLVRAFGQENKPEQEATEAQAGEVPAAEGRATGADEQPSARPAVARPTRPLGEGSAPAVAGEGGAADGGARDSAAAAKLTNPTKSRAELKGEAQSKQVALYRGRLSTLVKQRERLMQSVARLKREGASASQIESVQRRVQQLIEAEPRMRKHLEQLEKKAAGKKEGGDRK